MKRTKKKEKTVFYWRNLSRRINGIGIIILLIGLFTSIALKDVIYLMLIGGIGSLCLVASSILYYEMCRCPKCDTKLPNSNAFLGDINVCPYCGFKLKVNHEKVDTNLL